MSEPPAGWYPDPEAPRSGRARYWDGSGWTESYRTPERGRGDVALAVLGVLLMLSAAVVAALNYDAEEVVNAARVVGYGFGALVGPLLIVSAVRGLYVLVRRDRPFWSPWLLVASGIVGWLAVLGQTSSNT